MLKTDAVGWANKFTTNRCTKCGKTKSLQFVQTQKRFRLGKLKIINLGPRDFAFECSNCNSLFILNKTELRESKKLAYYFQRPTAENVMGKSELTKNVKYPVLSLEKRNKIRSDNQKEGLISAVIGVVIGVVLANWFAWAIWVMIVSVLFGVYAAFEDPEHKFRADIEKAKPIHQTKIKSKRTLQ